MMYFRDRWVCWSAIWSRASASALARAAAFLISVVVAVPSLRLPKPCRLEHPLKVANPIIKTNDAVRYTSQLPCCIDDGCCD